MIKQGKDCDIEIFKQNARAILEHMFNNHVYCNSQWCLALRAQEEGKTYLNPSGWLSCSDDVGKKIYDQLKEVVNMYGNKFYLRQSMHGFSTQTNEALNQSQVMLTPKAKIFH